MDMYEYFENILKNCERNSGSRHINSGNSFSDTVTSLRSNGFSVDSYGNFEAPDDYPLQSDGYVDADGNLHYNM